MSTTVNSTLGSTQKYVPPAPPPVEVARRTHDSRDPCTASHSNAQPKTVAIQVREIFQFIDIDFWA
jgi:hypothetical protein